MVKCSDDNFYNIIETTEYNKMILIYFIVS